MIWKSEKNITIPDENSRSQSIEFEKSNSTSEDSENPKEPKNFAKEESFIKAIDILRKYRTVEGRNKQDILDLMEITSNLDFFKQFTGKFLVFICFNPLYIKYFSSRLFVYAFKAKKKDIHFELCKCMEFEFHPQGKMIFS